MIHRPPPVPIGVVAWVGLGLVVLATAAIVVLVVAKLARAILADRTPETERPVPTDAEIDERMADILERYGGAFDALAESDRTPEPKP